MPRVAPSPLGCHSPSGLWLDKGTQACVCCLPRRIKKKKVYLWPGSGGWIPGAAGGRAGAQGAGLLYGRALNATQKLKCRLLWGCQSKAGKGAEPHRSGVGGAVRWGSQEQGSCGNRGAGSRVVSSLKYLKEQRSGTLPAESPHRSPAHVLALPPLAV